METKAEEIARLMREIGERQARLQYLALGDQAGGVSVPDMRHRYHNPTERKDWPEDGFINDYD